MTKYDVIIVGSGPAGAVLGYVLASQSASVLIIEKAKLPRHKTCGGGLTGRTLSILPFDVSAIIEDYTHNAKIFMQNKIAFSETSNDPIIAMVMRDTFDHFLANKAIDKGVILHENTKFRSLSGTIGNLNVETSKGKYNARIIVGADGIHSRVARSLGLRVNRKVMHGIGGEVYFENPEVVSRYKGSAEFDFGVVPYGYGWIFPKKNHLSIGVLSCSKKIKNLRHHFKYYIKMKGLSDFKKMDPLSSCLISCGPAEKNVYADPNGLVIGDAAGFSDPITGEGIYYAIREAHLASRVITNSLASGYDHLTSYNKRLNEELMREMICGKRIAYMLYRLPGFSYKILKDNGKKLTKYQLDIIRGKKTYHDLQKKILKLSTFWSALLRRS